MVDFSKLKRSKGDLSKLSKALEDQNNVGKNNDNENFWKLESDKAGNGFAIIRFLPAPPQDGEDALPWVKVFSHGFKVNNKWYIEKSLTTPRPGAPSGATDPVSEMNGLLWATGLESDKATARARKRKLSHVSNILVIKDTKHPENEGKVFKYRYGKKIFDKIQDKMHPKFEDETAINPFDLWEGANFKLKVQIVEEYPNYDKSEFETPSIIAIDGKTLDDKALEALWKSEYSLMEELDEKKFKTYDELKKQLDKVLGDSAIGLPSAENASPAKPRVTSTPKATEKTPPWVAPETEEEDDELKHFRDLVGKD